MRNKIFWGASGLLLSLWLLTLPAIAAQFTHSHYASNHYAAITSTPTPNALSCTTNSDELNLREGPGKNYRSLRKLERNIQVSAYAVNRDRSWVHVRVPAYNLAGWVAQQFLRCPANGLTTLPTATPPPTPTPKPYSGGYTDPCVRQDCGSPGDFAGVIRIPNEVLAAAEPTVVFGKKVVFELFARPTEPSNVAIAQVEFVIRNKRTGFPLVYYHVETSAPYCVFGKTNNSAVCNRQWDVAATAGVWPPSDPDAPFDSSEARETNFDPDPETVYQVSMFVKGVDEVASGFWFFDFKIDPSSVGGSIPVTPTPPTSVESDFSGAWYTNFAALTLQQNGNQVSGSYQRYGRNEAIALNGTVNGRILTGNFGNNPADQMTFTLSADGNHLEGAWLYRRDGQWRQWCGVRVELGVLPDGCGFSGDWFTISDYPTDSPPTARLQQIGPQVTGTFFNGSSTGTLEGALGQAGTLSHHSLSGVYQVNGSRGAFRWDLLDFNSAQFAGCWANNQGAHEWCGWRADGEKPAQCFPSSGCP